MHTTISRLPSVLSYRVRLAITLLGTFSLLSTTLFAFWYQDWRYTLPTPRPANLTQAPVGLPVVLPTDLGVSADRRPLLLHFFNPACPCSRFNAPHVRELQRRFGQRVRFVAVLQTSGTPVDTAQRERDLTAARRLLGLEVVADSSGQLAAACGVYSTPQAVILDASEQRTLLFRGNYNVARYCEEPSTQFVRLALENLIDGRTLPTQERAALVAYGCELPANVKTAIR